MADSSNGWQEFRTAEGDVYYANVITGESSWDKPAELQGEESSEEYIWIPHPTHGYLPGRFIQSAYDGTSDVVTLDGEQLNVKEKQHELLKVLRSALDKNVSDLVQMDNINEAMIVHNLRKRFTNNQIYTNIGTILISVNPFKQLPLYTPTVIDEYMHKGTKEMPPHTYNIADQAYRDMLDHKINQSILISGESGAGKTECTKQCLTYFAELAGSKTGVEQYILLANPILEAFGNAKTLRNNNSSRFGKWVEIHFDESASICGAKTINYLLEKSRVVYQIPGERNFHIFYQLTTGATAEQKRKWRLSSPDSFNFLKESGCTTVDGINDPKDFEEVQEAMQSLHFNPEEIEALFQTVAAILHLGNIEFTTGSAQRTASSEVKNKDQVGVAASLLGVPPAQLDEALTSRLMEIRGCEPTRIPLSPEQAIDARNALAKSIYGKMFDWLVQRINKSMEPAGNVRTSCIGVLDIFGFEIFENNSFEQLCINFTNEKLQQHFNQYTFKLEEQLYSAEGVNYEHIVFIDNQPVLDLIEKKVPQGIMITMDEQISVPKATDETCLTKMDQIHGGKGPGGSSSPYEQVKTSRKHFKIKHYAGEVTYDITGFLDKNRDTLQKDLLLLCEGSKNVFLNTLYPAGEERKTSKVTLGAQFRKQLTELMEALNKTEPHYIRCIKPNDEKLPDRFNGFMSLQQLRYAGVFEAVRIRQTGFPFRYTHEKFLERYGFMKKDVIKGVPPKKACEALLKNLKGNLAATQIGKTRVLYRAPEQRQLELLRNIEVEKITILLQASARGMNARQLMHRMSQAKPILSNAIQARTLQALTAALDQTKDIDFPMRLIAQAKQLKHVIEREIAITQQLQQLLNGGQDPEVIYDRLLACCTESEEINFSTPLVQQAKQVVTEVKNRRECIAALKAGTEESDRKKLEAAISRAQEINLNPSTPALQAAKQELDRIAREEELVQQLKQCMATGAATVIDANNWDHSTIDSHSIASVLSNANNFGMRTQAGKQIVKEAKVILDIRKALQAGQYDTVSVALREASSMEFTNPEIKAATDEVSHNTAASDVLANILAAMEAHDQASLAYGLEQAKSLAILDKEECIKGQELLDQIQYTRFLLQEAIEEVNQSQLERAVAQADSFGYCKEEYPHAVELMKKTQELNHDAATGLYYMEKEIMERVLAGADEIKLKTKHIDEIRELLCLDEQKFIQKQLQTANRLGDKERAIRLTIALKETFFSQFGRMFVFEEFDLLRDREDFSKAKLFGRDELKLNMLKWTKKPIPTSLTRLNEPFKKQATRLFKNILGWMGDKPLPYPNSLAQDLLDQGLATPEIRNEVYCQLIKQLSDNPNSQSEKKGLQLMTFCLQTFPPTEEFLNYLEMWLTSKDRNNTEKYVDMLHDTQYGPAKHQAPKVEDLLQRSGPYVPLIDLNKRTHIDESAVPEEMRREVLDGDSPAAFGGAAAAPKQPSQPQQQPTPVQPAAAFDGGSEPVGPLPPPPTQAPPASAQQRVQALYAYDSGGDPEHLTLHEVCFSRSLSLSLSSPRSSPFVGENRGSHVG
ncbi:myosin-5 isoform X3, variant 2 [Balamuthia mandrillaris]